MLILQQAQYLINEFGKPDWGGGITPLKLQKLLYYIKSWSLVADQPLIEEPFEKWAYGPVNPLVYDYFKSFGSQPLQPGATSYQPSASEKELLDFIATCYAQYNALTLSAMTHREDPWQKTKKDQVISESLIKSYYNTLPFANNFPFDPDNAFYPILSDARASFTLDMSKEEADELTVYPSYRDYLEHLEKARGLVGDWYNSMLV